MKNAVNHINYPDRDSEFEVQAELYSILRSKGYHVRGNVQARCMDFGKRHKVYFDLVVFVDLEAVAIIECKNLKQAKPLSGRQLRRYSMFGVPVICCCNMGEIGPTIEAIECAAARDSE